MMEIFNLADEFGPAKVVHVCEPSIGLKATLVVDNVAIGPAIGGLRIAPNTTLADCCRLARAMTLKSAAADLPHGGGKSVIIADPAALPVAQKQLLVRAFASALRNEQKYIFAPDMGTDEECMAWVRDEIGRAVGLPRVIGGIPLDQIGATGWGLFHATEVALHYRDFKLEDARVVVQGFGAVGRHVARFLTENGAVLVGAADSRGAVYNAHGLDVNALIELKMMGKSVVDFPYGERRDRDSVVDFECDIWIPAAGSDALTRDNVDRLRARLVVEGANIPVSEEAERCLHERGILCVPDFIANAGGLICAALEYRGVSQATALSTIKEKIRRNTERVLETVESQGLLPREAALKMAIKRVRKAMTYRRWNLFSSAPGFV